MSVPAEYMPTGWVPNQQLSGLTGAEAQRPAIPAGYDPEQWAAFVAAYPEVAQRMLSSSTDYGADLGFAPNPGAFDPRSPDAPRPYNLEPWMADQRREGMRGFGAGLTALFGGAALASGLGGAGAAGGTGSATVAGSNTAAGVAPAAAGGPSLAAIEGWAPAAAAGGGGAIMSNLPAIISGASTLIGGKLASDAAGDATDATLQANREALDYQRESRDIALGLLEPERQSANAAMARMLQMQGLPIPASLQAALDESGVALGEFNVSDTPGYQFRLKEAMDALETSAFARGGGMAGGFGEYALRYAQDYASNEYQNIYNQLATLTGRNTSTGGASVALNYGGNAAEITQDSGAARASGYVAQSNAWQNALDQISQLPWDQWFPGRRRQPTAVARGGSWG